MKEIEEQLNELTPPESSDPIAVLEAHVVAIDQAQRATEEEQKPPIEPAPRLYFKPNRHDRRAAAAKKRKNRGR